MDNDHGVKITLCHVPGATCEGRGEDGNSPAIIAGLIVSLQGVAEPAALTTAKDFLTVSLVLRSFVLNLTRIVNHLLWKPVADVKHGGER